MSMTCVGIQWVDLLYISCLHQVVPWLLGTGESVCTWQTQGGGKTCGPVILSTTLQAPTVLHQPCQMWQITQNGKPIFSLMAIEYFKCLPFHRWLLCFWSDWLTCGVPGWNPEHSRSTSLINVFMLDIDQINHMLSLTMRELSFNI